MADRTPEGPFRVALFSGLLGSVGATLGWLAWIAFQAVAKDWKVLLAPVIGASLGYGIDWLERYIHTARHEAQEGPRTAPEPDAPEHAAAPELPSGRANIRAWVIALGFLAVACEHLVGHLMSEFLVPFLASLATLFPVGALFGWLLYGGRGDGDSILYTLFSGALLGAVAALVAAGVQALMGAAPQWSALFGWWVLVGMGVVLVCPRDGAPTPLHTVGGVLVSLTLVVVCCIPGLGRFLQKTPPPISVPTLAITSAVDSSLRAPDVPAAFWIEAEARAASHGGDSKGTKHGEPQAAPSDSPGAGGSQSEHSQALPLGAMVLAQASNDSPFGEVRKPYEPGGRSFPDLGGSTQPPGGLTFPGSNANAPFEFGDSGSGALNAPSVDSGGSSGLGPGNLPSDGGLGLGNMPSGRGFGLGNMPSGGGFGLRDLPSVGFEFPRPSDPDYVARMLAQAKDPALERQRILRQEWSKGMGSGLVRSWIVLLLFAFGVGLGPIVEGWLRPQGAYGKSATSRNDLLLAWVTGALILIACLVVRVQPRERPAARAASAVAAPASAGEPVRGPASL